MLKDDPDEIFFGLGLLINNGSVKKLFDDKMESSPITTSLNYAFYYPIEFMLLVNMENKRIEIKETIIFGENNI